MLPDGVIQHNFYKTEILLACVHGRRKDFFQGALVDCSKSCSRDGPEVVKFVFYHSNIRKTTFFAEIP